MTLDEIREMFPGVALVEPSDDGLVWGWRTCLPDMTSRDGFQWPHPGAWAEQNGPADGQACGPGLHVAKTVHGATSAGYRRTVQVVAYDPADVLGEGGHKLRVRRVWVGGMADLHTLLVPGADLYGANLRYANLRYADLRCVNLRCADLRGANLISANLRYANLIGANLRGADLYGANLSYADLSYANLSYANLSCADMSCANLSCADLSCANLSGAALSSANLSGADLSGADLSGADLSGAVRS